MEGLDFEVLGDCISGIAPAPPGRWWSVTKEQSCQEVQHNAVTIPVDLKQKLNPEWVQLEMFPEWKPSNNQKDQDNQDDKIIICNNENVGYPMFLIPFFILTGFWLICYIFKW